MRTLYLHGFASSPASRKARWFLEKLGAQGIPAEALDLAPDFRHLTISGQLAVLEQAVQGERVVLIGSSLGGYLAALYAARNPAVERLILLAPAFDFYRLWATELGPEKMQEWRENGSISVFHYGTGRQASLGYQMMEDARQYEAFPDFNQPCLILHGLEDRVVPFKKSAEFAHSHTNVTLIPLHSGHELTDKLSEIWQASSRFLLSPSTKVE